MRKSWKIATVTVSILALLWLGWQLLPETPKASSIRFLPFGGSYATYDRLADMLKIGMTTDQARQVLGRPSRTYRLPQGHRWVYSEAEGTTGWLCLVDFVPSDTNHSLTFFCNVEHIGFPTTRHRDFGKPIDDGEFDGFFLLQDRWLEWKGRPNQSVERTRHAVASHDHTDN